MLLEIIFWHILVQFMIKGEGGASKQRQLYPDPAKLSQFCEAKLMVILQKMRRIYSG